jgi:hypothetical protein
MEWTDLAQDMNTWRGLMKTVLTLDVPKNAGDFFTRSETISFS